MPDRNSASLCNDFDTFTTFLLMQVYPKTKHLLYHVRFDLTDEMMMTNY